MDDKFKKILIGLAVVGAAIYAYNKYKEIKDKQVKVTFNK